MRITDNIRIAIESYFGRNASGILHQFDLPNEEQSRDNLTMMIASLRGLLPTDAAKFTDCIEEIQALIEHLEGRLKFYEAHYLLVNNPALFCALLNQDGDLPEIYFDGTEDDFYFWLEDNTIQVYATPFKYGAKGIAVDVYYFDKETKSFQENMARTVIEVPLPEVPVEEMIVAISEVLDSNFSKVIDFVNENKPEQTKEEEIDIYAKLRSMGLVSDHCSEVSDFIKSLPVEFPEHVKF